MQNPSSIRRLARIFAGFCGAATSLFSVVASAQQPAPTEFGSRGQVALSAERLFGFYGMHTKSNTDGTFGTGAVGGTGTFTSNAQSDATSFVFLGHNDATGPAAIPRLAVDFFPIDHLSVGGALIFKSDSNDTTTKGTTTIGNNTAVNDNVDDSTDTTVFGIAPRVGGAFMFTPLLGFWGRGGLNVIHRDTTQNQKQSDPTSGNVNRTIDTEVKIWHWSLSLEAFLVITPIDHIGFAVGPFLDFPLTGSIKQNITNTAAGQATVTTNGEGDFKATSYGLTSSLIAWF